jgi:hypothetical protein
VTIDELEKIRKLLAHAAEQELKAITIDVEDLALLLGMAERSRVHSAPFMVETVKVGQVTIQHVGPAVIVVPQTEAPLPPGTVVCARDLPSSLAVRPPGDSGIGPV